MNKQHILTLIIGQLEADISITQQAVDIARDTATHKDCLGSSKYETMGTEASYLAKGQGERLLELQRSLAYFKHVSFKHSDTIVLSSLLVLEDEHGTRKTFWLAADAGGLKILCDAQTITVITLQSPLGKAVFGQQSGDDVCLYMAGKKQYFNVLDVY